MKRVIILLMGLIVLLSACSLPWMEEQVQPKKPTNMSVEEMIKEGPGTHGGNNYHPFTFQQILSQFPDNLSAEETFSQLKRYLAEDYASHIEEIEKVDPTFYTNLQKGQPQDVPSTVDPKASQPTANVVVLLDASGSMRGKLDGKVKIDLAKEAIQKFVSKLPQGVRVSLKVYGHKGSGSNRDKAVSCGSIETVYPLGPYNASQFQAALNRFQPSGWTPLAKAIEDSAKDFGQQTNPDVKNVIYVVSDGKETCDGDPIQAAQRLNQSHIQAVVNIIGFDVKDEEQKALKEIAVAGKGEYVRVDTPDQLRRELERESMQKWIAWNQWGNRTWVMIQYEWQDKFSLIHRHYQDLKIKSNRESSRLNDSARYLNQLNKLSDQELFKLQQMIHARSQTIQNHYHDVYVNKSNLLKRIRDQLQEDVRKKKEEMQNQYRQAN